MKSNFKLVKVNPNYLENEEDLNLLTEAVEKALKMVSSAPNLIKLSYKVFYKFILQL